MTIHRAFLRDTAGATAVEFTMVLPVLLLFLFGIIDGGRFLYATNRAEKATQAGVRMAVVTAPVASGLVDEDYVGVDGLTPGDTIPASALAEVVCTEEDECTCSGSCPTELSADADAFDKIADRVQAIDPSIPRDKIEVVYKGSGLGFAGDPAGMDVSPFVTVRLKDMTFDLFTGLGLISIDLPDFAATLTAEDMAGFNSN
jgi:hypothetical protein